MRKSSVFINGTCTQLLFSPKGGIEGILLHVKGSQLQVVVDPKTGESLARNVGIGKRVRLLAVLDKSPKCLEGEHPVYQFTSFADASGHASKPESYDPEDVVLKGVVSALHYARHGQPNGVVLDTGEFIHIRPKGMVKLGLTRGAKVTAKGASRMTLLGSRMLEASSVNRSALEP